MKGPRQRNEEVKKNIKDKQDTYTAIVDVRTQEEREVRKPRYKIARKEAKTAVTIANHNTYEMLYQKLETQEGENEVFKLARARDRRTSDLGTIRCIKDEDSTIIVEDTKIKERQQNYFYNLFNGQKIENPECGEPGDYEEQQNFMLCHHIIKEETKEARRKIWTGKVVGPISIHVKI